MSTTFHKNIDLLDKVVGKENQQPSLTSAKRNGGGFSVSINTSVGKHHNSSINASFFSKSTLQNSMFPSFRSTSMGPVPKVSIQSIIKQKAKLYYDETLAPSLDELLESGYSLVQSKKQELDALKKQEETFMNEILAVEKEVMPLISTMMGLKDKVQSQKGQKEKFESEIAVSQTEIQELTKTLAQKQEFVKEEEKKHLSNIAKLETASNQIRNEIAQNKAVHKGDKENLARALKAKNDELAGLVTQLGKIRSKYNERKHQVSEKLRKMENKSKMFIGILQH